MAPKKGLKAPSTPSKPLTLVVLGVGQRGTAVASYSKHYPEWIKVVGVCDLDGIKCQQFAKEYDIPKEKVFVGDWTLLSDCPKFADAVAICTLDRLHVGPAVALANLKYHIMLEKPMGVTMEECVEVYNAVIRNNVILAVSHVFRYTRYQQTVKKILDSKVLGEIMNIQLLEPIGFWHFAHSAFSLVSYQFRYYFNQRSGLIYTQFSRQSFPGNTSSTSNRSFINGRGVHFPNNIRKSTSALLSLNQPFVPGMLPFSDLLHNLGIAVIGNKSMYFYVNIFEFGFSPYRKCMVWDRVYNVQYRTIHYSSEGYLYFQYVRGNWHNEDKSTFSLLTKSCHDLDVLADMMTTKCKRISSFGSLTHFKKEKKPKEAGKAVNCLDCAYEKKCPYSAKQIYIEPFEKHFDRSWPISVVQPHGEIEKESLVQALRTGNYGRCVYEMDNDVCDQQVVNMEFESGATASFSMIAFTEVDFKRKTRIFGTKGQLEGDGGNEIKLFDFLSRKTKLIRPTEEPNTSTLDFGKGRGSCSYELMQSFIFACVTGNQNYILTGPKQTIESHLYVFAAEHARRSGTVVDIDEYRKQFVLEEPELPDEPQLCCSFGVKLSI